MIHIHPINKRMIINGWETPMSDIEFREAFMMPKESMYLILNASKLTKLEDTSFLYEKDTADKLKNWAIRMGMPKSLIKEKEKKNLHKDRIREPNEKGNLPDEFDCEEILREGITPTRKHLIETYSKNFLLEGNYVRKKGLFDTSEEFSTEDFTGFTDLCLQRLLRIPMTMIEVTDELQYWYKKQKVNVCLYGPVIFWKWYKEGFEKPETPLNEASLNDFADLPALTPNTLTLVNSIQDLEALSEFDSPRSEIAVNSLVQNLEEQPVKTQPTEEQKNLFTETELEEIEEIVDNFEKTQPAEEQPVKTQPTEEQKNLFTGTELEEIEEMVDNFEKTQKYLKKRNPKKYKKKNQKIAPNEGELFIKKKGETPQLTSIVPNSQDSTFHHYKIDYSWPDNRFLFFTLKRISYTKKSTKKYYQTICNGIKKEKSFEKVKHQIYAFLSELSDALSINIESFILSKGPNKTLSLGVFSVKKINSTRIKKCYNESNPYLKNKHGILSFEVSSSLKKLFKMRKWGYFRTTSAKNLQKQTLSSQYWNILWDELFDMEKLFLKICNEKKINVWMDDDCFFCNGEILINFEKKPSSEYENLRNTFIENFGLENTSIELIAEHFVSPVHIKKFLKEHGMQNLQNRQILLLIKNRNFALDHYKQFITPRKELFNIVDKPRLNYTLNIPGFKAIELAAEFIECPEGKMIKIFLKNMLKKIYEKLNGNQHKTLVLITGEGNSGKTYLLTMIEKIFKDFSPAWIRFGDTTDIDRQNYLQHRMIWLLDEIPPNLMIRKRKHLYECFTELERPPSQMYQTSDGTSLTKLSMNFMACPTTYNSLDDIFSEWTKGLNNEKTLNERKIQAKQIDRRLILLKTNSTEWKKFTRTSKEIHKLVSIY